MLRKLLVFLFCIFIFTETGFGFEIDADSLINKLPREYTGTYQWENSNDPWDVSVTLKEVKKLSNGNIELNGKESFINIKDKNKTFESNVRAVIDPKTLAFEMEEIYLEQKDGFQVMVYKGYVSSDLKDINADWISAKGKKVTMVLKAKTI
jgi:hypothetical protein